MNNSMIIQEQRRDTFKRIIKTFTFCFQLKNNNKVTSKIFLYFMEGFDARLFLPRSMIN